MSSPTNKPLWRTAFGGGMAIVIIVGFVASGFIEALAPMVTDTTIKMPDWWTAAMLSLASAAFGWLIGNKEDERPKSSANNCPRCGEPLD